MNDPSPLSESSAAVAEPVAAASPVATPWSDAQTWSWASSGLLLLAILTLLYLASDLVLPVVMALILNLVFLPVVRGMKRLWIPAPLGAGLVVLGLLAAFIAGVYNLAEPAADWLERAPQSLRVIDAKVRRLTGSVQDVASVTAHVEDLTQQLANVGNNKKVQEVVVKSPGFAVVVLSKAQSIAVTAVSTLVLLYFLLASGDLFLRKTIAVTPRLSDKKRAVHIAHEVEDAVSTYLLTVALINTGLGIAVAAAMYLLGVPNPLLWGVMVGVFNFIPYLGDIASVSVLLLVGLLSFDDPVRSLMVPGAFFLLTAIEGYLITPTIVGRRLSLNPVVIVLSVMFWGWMWGIPGALMAVPILVTLKTLCDRVPSMQSLGEFLSD